MYRVMWCRYGKDAEFAYYDSEMEGEIVFDFVIGLNYVEYASLSYSAGDNVWLSRRAYSD